MPVLVQQFSFDDGIVESLKFTFIGLNGSNEHRSNFARRNFVRGRKDRDEG